MINTKIMHVFGRKGCLTSLTYFICHSFYNEGRSESDVLAAIRMTYESGAVIGGTSAGAACMPTAVMVTGGSSYDVSANLCMR